MEILTRTIEGECSPTLDKLPTEIILHIMGSMLPREVLTLAEVSIRMRSLSLWQLHHSYGLQVSEKPWLKDIKAYCVTRDNTNEERTLDFDTIDTMSSRNTPPMSDFELYVRLVLFDFYIEEMAIYGEIDSKPVVMAALSYAKKLLRRLYQYDPANGPLPHDLGTPTCPNFAQPLRLNPYTTASENTHVLARVIADQVCQGVCYPETAVLLLQCLCSLHDQDQFQFMVNSQERDVSLRLPLGEERVTMGQLCFQYLVPVILALLKPPLQQTLDTDLSQEQPPLFPFKTSPNSGRPASDDSRILTANTLPEQLVLITHPRIRSVQHLTKILCFLPLLGRHFNTLPTSTFIETFLDRSKGYIPIDKAAVLVYGFMCVLDLETGKANLASDSYRIFERSMPTQGVVQAKEMVRTVERHRALMRGFLLSSPTFSSSRIFRQSIPPPL